MSAYHYVWHTTQQTGGIITRHETNDDNDDGHDDGEVTRWTVPLQPRHQALRSPYDRSHIGCSGVYVYVYLDGKEVT